MPGSRVEIQLVHLGLDPKWGTVTCRKRALDASANVQKREDRLGCMHLLFICHQRKMAAT